MIYGERVRQVRKLGRKTQKAVAEAVDVRQNTVSQIESGLLQPSQKIIDAIVLESGFPERFFTRPPGPEFPLGSLVFRARKTASKRDYEEAHAAAELVFEIALDLATRLKVRPPQLPNLGGEDPATAAQMARSVLGLSPDRPITNLIHSLEQYGVFVLALPQSLPGRDAFSTWAGVNPRYPVIFLPTSQLGGRLRFTIAHEFDHLLSPDFRGYSRQAELAADLFAAEFLAPQSRIASELPSPFTLRNVVPIARRWGVSVQFIIKRAVDLQHISQRRAQQLYRELASTGFARREPPGAVIPIEKPRLFKRMVESVYGVPTDADKLASNFDVPFPVAVSLLDAHAERSEIYATVPVDIKDNLVEFTLD